MTLWFLVPAFARFALTRICLENLARTCETLTERGLTATAVVVADDENLTSASALGFGTIRQANAPLGRKWNDAYQFACDPAYNPRPADFVVPMGSDDWVDPELILSAPLPEDDEMTCFRLAAFVREDGGALARLRVTYPGGLGIRIIPRSLVARAGYRPADEDRRRALDASTHLGLRKANRSLQLVYHDLHTLQIVDWKSRTQLNGYESCLRHALSESKSPFDELAGVYPEASLEDMRALYPGARERVLA